jgi:hypothetical protein
MYLRKYRDATQNPLREPSGALAGHFDGCVSHKDIVSIAQVLLT